MNYPLIKEYLGLEVWNDSAWADRDGKGFNADMVKADDLEKVLQKYHDGREIRMVIARPKKVTKAELLEVMRNPYRNAENSKMMYEMADRIVQFGVED